MHTSNLKKKAPSMPHLSPHPKHQAYKSNAPMHESKACIHGPSPLLSTSNLKKRSTWHAPSQPTPQAPGLKNLMPLCIPQTFFLKKAPSMPHLNPHPKHQA